MMASDPATESSADQLKLLLISTLTQQQRSHESVEHDDDTTVLGQLDDIIQLLQSAELETICATNLEDFDFQHFANFCCKVTGSKLTDFVFYLFVELWPHNQAFQFAFVRFILNDAGGGAFLVNMPKFDQQLLTQLEIRSTNPVWQCPCVYQILIAFASTQPVDDIFEGSTELAKIPSLLFIGLLECKQTESDYLHDLFSRTITKILKAYINPPKGAYNNAVKVFAKIWQDDNNRDQALDWARKIWIDALIKCYIDDEPSSSMPSSSSSSSGIDTQNEAEQKQRILEMCQDLKVFPVLQQTDNMTFLIDFACFASRRDYLNLETFLKENWMKCCQGTDDDDRQLTSDKSCHAFIEACLDFVRKRIDLIQQDPKMNESFMKPLKTMVNYFATNLQKLDHPPSHLEKECSNLTYRITQCSKNRIAADGVVGNQNHLDNIQFKPDVFDEVIKHLLYLLTGKQKIEGYLDLIKVKMASDENYFPCLLFYLHEWCRQCNTKPLTEFRPIGQLIGGLIKHKLVDGEHFVFFVWFMLQGLVNDPATRLFKLGVIILEQFISTLDKFPNISSQLAKCCLLPAKLLLQLDSKLIRVQHDSKLEGILNTVFNNLDGNNMQTLFMRVSSMFQENRNHLYICEKIIERAVSQAKHQELFMDFVVLAKCARIMDILLHMTYNKISKSLEDSTPNHKALKSLGNWLCLMTLGRNIPVMEDNLAVEELLYDACAKGGARIKKVVWLVSGLLNAVVVCKSIVFRPNCPWTMNKLVILAFIHNGIENDVDVIRFEIENLVKSYRLTLDNLLGYSNHEKIALQMQQIRWNNNRKQKVAKKVEAKLSGAAVIRTKTDTNNNAAEVSVLQDSSNSDTNSESGGAFFVPPPHPSTISYQDIDIVDLDGFCNRYIVIDTTAPLFQPFPKLIAELRNVFRQAIHSFLAHYRVPVIDTVLGTTKTLVSNDFMIEKNAHVVYRAACSHAATFTAGYTLVQIGEKFRYILLESLKQKCLEYLDGRVTPRLFDTVSEKLVNDNANNCIAFIQKSFVEEAVIEVSKRFPPTDPAAANDAVDNALRPKEARIMAFYENMGSNLFGVPDQQSQPQLPSNSMLMLQQQQHSQSRLSLTSSPDSEKSFLLSQEKTGSTDDLLLLYTRLMELTFEHIQELQACHINPEILAKLHHNLALAKEAPNDTERIEFLVNNVMDGLRTLLQKSNLFNMNGPESNALNRIRHFFPKVLHLLSRHDAFKMSLIHKIISKHFVKHWMVGAIDFPDPLFDNFSRLNFVDFESLDNSIGSTLRSEEIGAEMIYRLLSFLKCYLKDVQSSLTFRHSMAALKRIMLGLEPNHPLYLQLKLFFQAFPYREVMANTQMDYQKVFIKWASMDKTEENRLKIYNWITKELDKHDEALYEFLNVCLQYSLQRCYALLDVEAKGLENGRPQQVSVQHQYVEILDCFVMVTMLLLQYRTNDYRAKVVFIDRIVQLLVKSALTDSQLRVHHGIPYHRIILELFSEVFFFYSQLVYSDSHFRFKDTSDLTLQIGLAFAEPLFSILFQLSPAKVGEFTYPWIDLISNYKLIGKFLSYKMNYPHFRLWFMYFMLIRDFFDYLKKQNTQDPYFNEISKALVTLFFILWHDFPDFLCEFSNYLLEFIPMEYVQVRNLVLSATPSNSAGRSFSYQLSFGSLGGALFPYKGLHENAKLMASPFNEQLKSYLSSRSPPNLPEELHLYLSNIEDASKKEYIVNSIITFVSKFVTDNYDHMDSELFERNPGIPILQSMLTTLDPKGQYNCLNQLADHLRYPNIDTVFFSWTLLHLFRLSGDGIKERIFRILLERVTGNKPYPWGLCFTIYQLCCNSVFQLAKCAFMQLPVVNTILRSLEITVVFDGVNE